LSIVAVFTTHTLFEIFELLNSKLKEENTVTFIALNPDIKDHVFSGEVIKVNGDTFIYRGLKSWVNLAELLGCKMMTPKIVSEYLIEITFKKLQASNSFHIANTPKKEEKYGTDSEFAKISKNEEATFLYHYKKALESVKISGRRNILDIGINKADEFDIIKAIVTTDIFAKMKLVGIDHSSSALELAKDKFPNAIFLNADINYFDTLDLGAFDLIISIGTLQSPGINYKLFLMNLVQNHISENGAIILGFPNSRWIDGELIYGAKAPNYNYSEMSLVFNDVIFAKKYLQQKKFRVTITGREYIFLTATKIGLNRS
jgi:hypothetical protein